MLIFNLWNLHLIIASRTPLNLDPLFSFWALVNFALPSVFMVHRTMPVMIAFLSFWHPMYAAPCITPTTKYICYFFCSIIFLFSECDPCIHSSFERKSHQVGITYITNDSISPVEIMTINWFSFTSPFNVVLVIDSSARIFLHFSFLLLLSCCRFLFIFIYSRLCFFLSDY